MEFHPYPAAYDEKLFTFNFSLKQYCRICLLNILSH